MANKIRILYAEDDNLGAELTKKILEKHDFLVEIADNGKKAWAAYKQQRPDILLLDLDMPQKNGIELTRLIRKKDPLIHIIIYTSHGAPEKEIAALDAGADEFICKERPSEVLVAHLKQVYRKIITDINAPRVYLLSPHTMYNASSYMLTIREESTRLASVEGRLLQLLCAKGHEIASREYLVSGIWKNASINKDSEIKKYVSLLRKQLKNDHSISIEYQEINNLKGYILLSTNK